MATMATAAAGDIRELAKIGARVRLEELDAQMRALRAERALVLSFTEVKLHPAKAAAGNGNGAGRHMSPQARKAVSVRMKKYWAKRRRGGK